MKKLKTPLDVYALLPKTNCRQCTAVTCMAFAAAVMKEEIRLSECPHLDPNKVLQLEKSIERQINLESIQEDALKEMQKQVSLIDLSTRAAALGALFTNNSLVIRCLGRDFEVDAGGLVRSQCHTHAWFSIPLLSYILSGKGMAVTGRWVPLRELEQGRKWAALFEQRCERPLQHIADCHHELFDDLVHLFSGAPSNTLFASDIAVVLYPLPRVPMLICYWKPEEDIGSKLHVFFDETVEQNLPMDALFTMATGFARMIEKIMMKHAEGRFEVL